jgi:hypothetical protein
MKCSLRQAAGLIGIVTGLLALDATDARSQGPVYTLAPDAQRIAVSERSIHILTSRGHIDRWENGLLTRVHEASLEESTRLVDLAAAPDGTLSAADGCRVVRIGSDDRWQTLFGRRACDYRSGEPAVGERLCLPPSSLEATPDGSIVVPDGCGRLLRIHPDGRAEAVAGLPENGRADRVLAALSDGTLIVSTPAALFRLPPGGPAAPIVNWVPNALAPVGGGFLIHRTDSGLALLDDTGRVRPVGTTRQDGRWNGDGDPVSRWSSPADLAVAPDGGWLLAAGGLRYVPPPDPSILAVAIRRQTLPPREPLRVSLSLTQAARVTVEVSAGGRRRAVRHANLAAGVQTVRIRGASRRALNVVRVIARRGTQRAEDELNLLTGHFLPMQIASWMAYGERSTPVFYDWQVEGRVGCRRFGARRVDCASYDDDAEECHEVESFRLRSDGRLAVYSYTTPGPCSFIAKPSVGDRPEVRQIPVDMAAR